MFGTTTNDPFWKSMTFLGKPLKEFSVAKEHHAE